MLINSNLKCNIFANTCILKDGLLIMEENSNNIPYNPFEKYDQHKTSGDKGSIHRRFASINSSSDTEILNFCSEFGLLTPTYSDKGTESIDTFKKLCNEYQFVFALSIGVRTNDINRIKEVYSKYKNHPPQFSQKIAGTNEKVETCSYSERDILIYTAGEISNIIDKYLKHSHPSLDLLLDAEIMSSKVTFKFENLIECLYMMLLLDTTYESIDKNNEICIHCNSYFFKTRPKQKHCNDPSCLNATSQKLHRRKNRVKGLVAQGKSIEEIEIILPDVVQHNESLIKKWVKQFKGGE